MNILDYNEVIMTLEIKEHEHGGGLYDSDAPKPPSKSKQSLSGLFNNLHQKALLTAYSALLVSSLSATAILSDDLSYKYCLSDDRTISNILPENLKGQKYNGAGFCPIN